MAEHVYLEDVYSAPRCPPDPRPVPSCHLFFLIG